MFNTLNNQYKTREWGSGGVKTKKPDPPLNTTLVQVIYVKTTAGVVDLSEFNLLVSV